MKSVFISLDSLLSRYQSLWRADPFYSACSGRPAWAEHYPELYQALFSLSDEEVERLKHDASALNLWLTQFIPDLAQLDQLSSLPCREEHLLDFSSRRYAGIPGRKLEQIASLSYHVIQHHKGSEWLEWCSGKGYLGRLLASESSELVTSLEYQDDLCQSGQAEADKQKLPMTFVQGDALSQQVESVFNVNQHAVALHACGDLHVSLLKIGTKLRLPAISISPCCYHLIQSDDYQPLSAEGRKACLQLTRQDLRIPLQETVTGGERVKRHRFLEMSYRLGFDLLLREQLGVTQYIPIPSIKKSSLNEGFEVFCYWASEKKKIRLPDVDFSLYQEAGELRYWQMEKLSLIQQAFRRPLEMWLVYDRALYLQSCGYQVELSTFCPKKITPRNILLHAERK